MPCGGTPSGGIAMACSSPTPSISWEVVSTWAPSGGAIVVADERADLVQAAGSQWSERSEVGEAQQLEHRLARPFTSDGLGAQCRRHGLRHLLRPLHRGEVHEADTLAKRSAYLAGGADGEARSCQHPPGPTT